MQRLLARRARQLAALAFTPAGIALAACKDNSTTSGTSQTISVSLAPASVTVAQGQNTTTTVTVATTGNFSGPVSLTVSGLPNGVTATFDPTPITPPNAVTSTLRIVTAASTTPGSYMVTVSASASGVPTVTAPLTLTVAAAPTATLTVAVTPAALSVAQGGNATLTVTIARGGGFAGTVDLSLETVPTGLTPTFTATTIAGTATTTTIAFAASPNAPAGSFTMTLRAKGTGVTDATATIPVTITPVGSFTIALSPPALSVAQGASGTSRVTVTPGGSFSGPVTLSSTGAPTGVTVTVPASVADTGTITVAVASAVAPGAYPIVVTAQAQGQTAQTATLALTVTAATPAGSFTLAASPAAVAVAQGGSATTTVTVTRAGGFAGPVDLTVAGAPTGVTITPNPTSVTGTSSTLTVSAASTAATGSSTITVTGSASGLTPQSTTFTVQVTQPTSGGNVGYSFQNCDPLSIPIWFAAQDGTGPWTRITPDANNVFRFNIAARGGVAYATRSGSSTQLTIFYAAANELGSVSTGRTCGTAPRGTKHLTGTVAGVGATDIASISLGGTFATVIGAQGLANFTLDSVADGPRDLVASRSALSGTSLTLNKLIIRRAVNYAANSAIPALDFGSSEAFDPVQRTITFNGLGTDQAFANVSFVTALGSSAPFFVNTGTGATLPYFGVPSAQLAAGDLHLLVAGATSGGAGATAVRVNFTYFRDAIDRTVTFGPPLSPVTVTSLATTPYLRLRAEFASQSDYNGFASVTYSQPAHTVSVNATAAYFGGLPATWMLDIPDLTSAAFDPTLGLQPGIAVTWSASAAGGDVLTLSGATPLDGAQFRLASRSGSSSAFQRLLRSHRIVIPRTRP